MRLSNIFRVKMNKKSVVVIALIIWSLVFAYSLMQFSMNMYNYASIKIVGLSADKSSIDWGLIEPNSTTIQNVTFINTGNTPVNLTFYTQNWVPSNASQYLTLTWNYNDTILNPTESYTVEFSLFVHPDISGITSFSFEIVVVATESI